MKILWAVLYCVAALLSLVNFAGLIIRLLQSSPAASSWAWALMASLALFAASNFGFHRAARREDG